MKYMNDDQLLVLRSTVYPGVSKRVKDWLEEENHFLMLLIARSVSLKVKQ